MSQSDYIQYKKNKHVLKVQADLPPVLSSKDYTAFSGYAIETTTTNDKTPLSQLTQSGYITVYGMETKVTNCPTFTLCQNTNGRANRVALYGPLIDPQIPFPVYRTTKECPLYVKCGKANLRSNILTPTTL